MDLLHDLLTVLWVFAPAGAANVAPILVARMPGLSRWTAPIDGGRMFRGRRVLGDHKTWRGLVSGIVAATLALGAQLALASSLGQPDWAYAAGFGEDANLLVVVLVGSLFAVGALGGDALKSFFKRQIGVAPGHSWPVFDQVDYVIGAALAVSPLIRFTPLQYVMLLAVWGGISLLASWVGYLASLKDAPI